MSQFKSEFLQILEKKGYVNQITHEKELDELMANKKIPVYIGFDCTAPSLHVGSLIQIMVLRILQKCGHQPIILLGQGTTKIGDPSGKDESRQLLDDAKIQENLKGIEKTLEQFDLSYDYPSLPKFKFVNNNDWLKDLNYIDFLREFGRHFSINRMLTFESVKLRLDRQQTLSFLEFNYMILQAYDFYKLNKDHECILQIGGSDQWGNIVNGVELTRRLAAAQDQKEEQIFGLTTPLLTTTDGKKMGKTAKGAVWLSKDLLDPYDYYQFFRNIDDKDVERFLKLFTELSDAELAKVLKEDINEQKKRLAFEATRICHLEEEAQKVAEQISKIFNNKGANLEDLPQIEISFNEEESKNGKKIAALIRDAGLCASAGEARRLIKGGAVKINDEKIEDENYQVTLESFKLSLGKKKFFKIIINK